MRSRSIFPVAIVCTIFGIASANSHAKGICDDREIVAGKKLGSLTLGMPVSEAMELMGKPELKEDTGTFEGHAWRNLYYYPKSDFKIIAEDDKIVELDLGGGSGDTPSCATRDGVQLGSKAKKVQKAYGAPDQKPARGAMTVEWTYDKNGISLFVDSQGGVLGLIVFTPGTYGTLSRAKQALRW
jgi:hypothetical protein